MLPDLHIKFVTTLLHYIVRYKFNNWFAIVHSLDKCRLESTVKFPSSIIRGDFPLLLCFFFFAKSGIEFCERAARRIRESNWSRLFSAYFRRASAQTHRDQVYWVSLILRCTVAATINCEWVRARARAARGCRPTGSLPAGWTTPEGCLLINEARAMCMTWIASDVSGPSAGKTRSCAKGKAEYRLRLCEVHTEYR